MQRNILFMIGIVTLTIALTACTKDVKPKEDKVQEIINDPDKSDAVEDGRDIEEDRKDDAEEKKDALGILNRIWAGFDDDEKFPGIGGDFENTVDGAPGRFNLAKGEEFAASYHIPQARVDEVTEAATFMHMMNANTFTLVALHTGDTESFAADLKKNIEGTQWICGFPDRLVIAEIGASYLVYAFGEEGVMENYYMNLNTAYPDAVILYDVNLAPDF